MYVRLLFVCLAVLPLYGQAQQPVHPGPEPQKLEAWRSPATFTHPVKPSATPVPRVPPRDTTRRRFAVKYTLPVAITSLLQQDLMVNEARREIDGFRVQVVATTSRDEAARAKTKALDLYGAAGHEVESLYERPYFKVRVGQFLNRTEAEKQCQQFRQDFSGAFVVPSLITKPY